MSFLLLALLLFLYKGITCKQLLEYEEVHHDENPDPLDQPDTLDEEVHHDENPDPLDHPDPLDEEVHHDENPDPLDQPDTLDEEVHHDENPDPLDEEVHHDENPDPLDQESRGFRHCYRKIVRVLLVSGKEGKWKPKDPKNSNYLTILESLYKEFRGPPKSKLSESSRGSSHTQAEAPFIQKLFGKLRIYYILLKSVIQKLCGELRIYYPLLESVRRVLLAIMAGFYKDNESSKIPTTFNLCINCFHLFFLVLEKPFIEKNIQLLEIMAVSSEACISAIMCVLGEKKLSDKDGKKFGILMIILVLVGILPQIMNELYDLYKQIKQLDSEKHSFLTGLKTALSGLTSLFSSKDNTADSNSKPTSVADEDKATSTSTSHQVKSPNQD